MQDKNSQQQINKDKSKSSDEQNQKSAPHEDESVNQNNDTVSNQTKPIINTQNKFDLYSDKTVRGNYRPGATGTDSEGSNILQGLALVNTAMLKVQDTVSAKNKRRKHRSRGKNKNKIAIADESKSTAEKPSDKSKSTTKATSDKEKSTANDELQDTSYRNLEMNVTILDKSKYATASHKEEKTEATKKQKEKTPYKKNTEVANELDNNCRGNSKVQLNSCSNYCSPDDKVIAEGKRTFISMKNKGN